MPVTPKFPLSLDEYTLYESTEDIVEITRFHVKNIVLTNPGEKISDPNFGVGIKRYLFQNFTQKTVSNIRFRIRAQMESYLPQVEILSIDIEQMTDDNMLSLKLSYYIPIINKSDILSFSISNSTSIY